MLMFNSNDVQLQNVTRNSLVKVSRVLNDPKVGHSNCTNFFIASSIVFNNSGVHCPLKLSKTSNAGKSAEFFLFFFFSETYGKIIFSKYM